MVPVAVDTLQSRPDPVFVGVAAQYGVMDGELWLEWALVFVFWWLVVGLGLFMWRWADSRSIVNRRGGRRERR